MIKDNESIVVSIQSAKPYLEGRVGKKQFPQKMPNK